MAYGDFKDLAKGTATDKVLRDKAFNIAKYPKYDGYQRGLASIVYKFFDEKTASLTDKSAAGSGIKSIQQNEKLTENFINPLLENLKKEKCIQHSKTIFGVLI